VAGGKQAGYAVIYATGLGDVKSDVAAGTTGPFEPLAQTVVEPAVRIGGRAARVLFSGLAPGLVGVYQVNAEWPVEAAAAAEIIVETAGRLSGPATLP
jgi:uncharacterized protein (TIGR03437 family)